MNLGISLSLGSTRAGPQGPTILLSASSIAENAVVGSTVGVLSVVNGTGTWTFTKTADPDAKFVLAGTGGANLNTAAALNADPETGGSPSHSVTIQATNGTETISRTFSIGVTNVFEQPSLNALTGTFTLAENSAQGTNAGTLSGRTAGSTLTLIDNAGGRVQLSGTTIQAGPTALDFEAAASHSFTVRETLADSANSPRDTTLTLTVTDVVEGGSPPLDFIGYGQSNWLFHVATPDGRPAANPDTLQWDETTNQWITPVGNGIRNFLNAMQAATGRVCRLVSGGQSGVGIGLLQKGAGTNLYENLLARVAASGANPSFIIFHQGEGNGNAANPDGAAYQAAMDTLHGSIVADLGKTKASCPFVCSSLANVTDGTVTAPDSSWQTIKNAQALVNSAYPNIYYSHSNNDAVLADGIHYTGASYGRSGQRYARTVQFLQGTVTTRPPWFATAAVRVTATTTRVTVVHAMGTDFTPTSGITGFQLSGDNGVNWVSGTGERETATTILLTHADLGTTERRVRYQFGKNPNVSAPVLDNGPLASPLNFTTSDLIAPGAALLPSITNAGRRTDSGGGAIQTHTTAFTVPGGSEELLAIIGVTSNGGVYSSLSVNAQPSNTNIAATLVESHTTSNPRAYICQAVLPVGTTSITVTITYTANPFTGSQFHVGTIPTARLTSTTRVGTGKSNANGVTNVTANLPTSAGGVVFAVGAQNSTSGTGTLSGTETYATRVSFIDRGQISVAGDASGTAANASSSVTLTITATNNTTLCAASWR